MSIHVNFSNAFLKYETDALTLLTTCRCRLLDNALRAEIGEVCYFPWPM